MNFINVNTTQVGNRPTSNANYIGLVYSNVLNSSLSFYLPLTGGIISSNLGIGNSISSLNNLYVLNVNSFIVASSNITACSNMITSNINSISINNSGVLTTSIIRQSDKNLISFRGLITSESNISFNQNNDILSLPVINASLMGGSGSRIIFKAAKNSSSLPDAIGLNTDTIWMSSSNILFYINNENRVTINSNGVIITSNQINQLNSGVNNFFMGKVGIATSIASEYNLNVNGSLNATSITINGSSISSSISDVIANSSNYTRLASNILRDLVNTNLSDSSNYTRIASNIIIENNSNFTLGTSNNLRTLINANLSDSSNFTLGTSNILRDLVNTNLSDSSNYTRIASNIIIENNSNFTLGTSNNLRTLINANLSDSSNYTRIASNIIIQNNSNFTLGSSLNTSNYTTNVSNALKTIIDTANTNISTNYLGKTGGNLSGQLDISTSTADNQITISTTSTTNYASIRFKNNSTNYGFIGIAATAVSGYYTNNLFLEATNAIVFNSGGNTTASANSPVMILNSSGNLGIGTTNPSYKLHLRGANPTLLRIETNTNDVNQVSGIEFGIPAFPSAGSAKITSTTLSGDVADLKFHTSASTNSSSAKMTIRGDGNIGISNTNPSQILQIGNAGRLRISNGTTDYSLLGTIDTDGALNTRIVLSGNTRSSAGNIEYVATSSGSHLFYTTDTTQERMRINSSGIITTSSNIDCGGGIAITGANAFFTPGGIITGDNGVDSNNLTNTYINFKNAGATGDWCYIRQIGTSEAYKLALDFHDDNNDARFCIRNVQSSVAGGVDVVREVFTVDNGNVGIGTNIPLQKLHIDTGCLFITNNVSNPGTVSSTSLWNQSGVGPTISGLQFVVQTNGTTERLRIDNNGLLTTSSNIDCGGGIAITGSTAFHNATAVNSNNLTNTYINFKAAGGTNDWCYLRQIGTNEAYKLALDFHDDAADARFCIRNIHSSLNPTDTETEVFTVDNGNVSCTGSIFITNTVNPYVQFGSVNGHNLGVATGAGGLSSSAATGDMVLRSINNLYLQSGTGGHALRINTGNNISTSGNISIGTTSILSRLTIKSMFNEGTAGGLCLDSADANIYNLRLYSFTPVANAVNWNFQVNNLASSINALTIGNNGNIGIGMTTPFASLCIGTPLATSDGTLVLSRKAVSGNRNFKFGYDTNFNFCMGDFGPDALTTSPWTSNQLSIKWDNGNVGIGTVPTSQKLYVNGETRLNGVLTFNNITGNRVISLFDATPTANNSQYVGIGANSGLVLSCSGTSDSFKFNVGTGTSSIDTVMSISGLGKTILKGVLNINGGTPFAINNQTFNNGSLIIGDTLLNYGGGNNWTTNTAGLMMECLDNTEIAVHDNGNRLSSLMYYEGGGVNKITIGRNMGWAAIAAVDINGNLSCTGNIFINNTSSPYLQFGSVNGHNLGVSTSGASFSASAATGDMVLRSINNLYLQSGGAGHALKIDTANNISTSGNIDCGKGLAITGADAFAWEADVVEAGNKTNTYINFRNAGASSDWCYLRQIGGANAYKLALDFHDDADDARFCIRSVASTNNPDTITEVFAVNNGNVSCTGTITSSGTLTSPGINLTTSATGNNVLSIKSTVTNANNSIWFRNNLDCNVYAGIGGSTYGGSYQNNFFIESANGAIVLNTQGRTSGTAPNFIINSSGNIGIGTTNPQTELELYDTINPKIYLNHNGTSRYFISGTSTSIDIGCDNGASKTIRFMPDNTERLRIDNNGLLTTTGNIDCGGGLAITGSTAFFNTTGVDSSNLTNTYINFKGAGAGNDWCYLRQIGGNESIKLAFDFLDDIDARFCLRRITSTATPDTTSEVFTVDNGNVTCTGKITLQGELANGNWKMTNDSDYCRLYNSAGTSYFNFGAKILYASDGLNVTYNGSIGGTLDIGGVTTIRSIVGDRGSYNHALAPLTITNQTPTGTTLNDSLPVLNLCRQGQGGVAYGARATLCLSRFENPGNVWSRTRLDFKLASDTYNDIMSMTLLSNGNYIFYPNPQNINNTNGANLTMNLNVGCYTSGFATAPFISCTVADGWNGIDTITTITAQSGANSGFNNSSRMILDGSYNTNAGRGTRASYICWQSLNFSDNWMTNAELYVNSTGGVLTPVFNVNGSVRSWNVTLSSSGNIKSNIRDIYDPLDLISKFEGKHYHNKLTCEKDFGLIAEDIEKICPCLTSRNEDSGVEIGIKYMNLTAVLIEGIKELNNKVQDLQNKIINLENILKNNNIK